jgi:hypothetical protein
VTYIKRGKDMSDSELVRELRKVQRKVVKHNRMTIAYAKSDRKKARYHAERTDWFVSIRDDYYDEFEKRRKHRKKAKFTKTTF